jgi:hypothetical protein
MADGVPGAVCQKVKTNEHIFKNSFTSQPAENQTKFLRIWLEICEFYGDLRY